MEKEQPKYPPGPGVGPLVYCDVSGCNRLSKNSKTAVLTHKGKKVRLSYNACSDHSDTPNEWIPLNTAKE
jgi:hypothetical protein